MLDSIAYTLNEAADKIASEKSSPNSDQEGIGAC